METVKERPILFSGEMVRAILDGRKIVTRRVVKPQPLTDDPAWFNCTEPVPCAAKSGDNGKCDLIWGGPSCPYGQPGERLWVRETFCPLERNHWIGDQRFAYKASCGPDGDRCRQDYIDCGYPYQWKPSIHMPREASRITLEVTDVRVEQLMDITGPDVAAEGFPFASDLDQFKITWDRLNAKRGFPWESNPWVWVVSFRRVGEG